jgi:hypothetical protein
MSAFSTTLKTFCEELRATFPELSATIDRALTLTPDQFWKMWQAPAALEILVTRDADALFEKRKGFIVGAVRLTPALWSELSENTQTAIWKYLRTLTLEATMELSLEGLDTETMQQLMNILTAERLEKGGADAEAAASEMFEESMSHLSPLMEKLKGMMGNFVDLSGMKDIPMPEIPEHLRNGRIAKLAEEMAKQFDPSEFGIDPALLHGENIEEVIKKLAEIYQRDPTKLIGGAKRVAEKIKTRILGGSINREELLAEAQEFVKLFKEHPLFKEAIAKFEGLAGAGGIAEMFGSGSGGGGGGTQSERRRAVQERLRKKVAARKAGGSGGSGK